MTARAYSRCNSGHYFAGEICPFDGWSSPATRELNRAIKRLHRLNQDLSVQTLRELGVSEATLARTIVIQFGSASSVFEAIAPEELVVNGDSIPLRNLDENFT